MSFIDEKCVFSGIYSRKYSHFYEQLCTVLEKYIPKENIQYIEVDQNIFDKHKDFGKSKCIWCDKKVCKFVFHQGETIKIETQLEIYEKYKNSDKIIIFTDCDIVINDDILNSLEKIYHHPNFNKFQIFYTKERNRKRWKAGINIGLTLGYSTDKIVDLYKNILHTMKTSSYPNNWDQIVVNDFFFNKKTDIIYDILPDNLLFYHKFARGSG
jgi:hypothetical protein